MVQTNFHMDSWRLILHIKNSQEGQRKLNVFSSFEIIEKHSKIEIFEKHQSNLPI